MYHAVKGICAKSEAVMKLETVSLGATAVLTVAVIGLLFHRSLFASGPISIGAQVAAALLMLWARVTFGWRSFHAAANPSEGGLVTRGPYHWVRHPIYLAILVFVWAGVASRGAVLDALMAIVATAAIAVRIGTEEALVVGRYPEYADYARRTKRLIPFVL
jgi:protein-S-isoprenylcysteine O-methyltransferase Ste14